MNEYSIKISFDWKSPGRLLVSGPDHNGDFAVRDFAGALSDEHRDWIVYGSGGRDPVESWGVWPPDADSFGPRPEGDIDRPLWEDNSIQFPRLLSEIIAVGLKEWQWDSLLLAMDLESDDLSELFDRAQAEWERQKEITRLALERN